MKNIFGLFVFIFGFNAHAGFMAEPFLSYDMGTSKITTGAATVVPGAEASSKVTGTSLGARLGYRFPNGVSLAAEYTTGSGKIKSDTAGVADEDSSKTAMGAVVGYDRGMFRVYGGYGFTDEMTEKTTGASGDIKFKGTNYKLGVGVMPIRHLSINFEYIVPKYTKYSDATTTSDTDIISDTYLAKFDTSITAISISAPFDFGK
jgi:hypothetical protein